MTTAYSTPGLFWTTVAVITCRCGRQGATAGLAMRSLPRGWVQISAERDEHLCPWCARYSEALARSK
jgi:hypothetical protein